jgi:hypothetical protein
MVNAVRRRAAAGIANLIGAQYQIASASDCISKPDAHTKACRVGVLLPNGYASHRN